MNHAESECARLHAEDAYLGILSQCDCECETCHVGCDSCGAAMPSDPITAGWFIDSELVVDAYRPSGTHVINTRRCPECW